MTKYFRVTLVCIYKEYQSKYYFLLAIKFKWLHSDTELNRTSYNWSQSYQPIKKKENFLSLPPHIGDIVCVARGTEWSLTGSWKL
jgi:hypothetical protein